MIQYLLDFCRNTNRPSNFRPPLHSMRYPISFRIRSRRFLALLRRGIASLAPSRSGMGTMILLMHILSPSFSFSLSFAAVNANANADAAVLLPMSISSLSASASPISSTVFIWLGSGKKRASRQPLSSRLCCGK